MKKFLVFLFLLSSVSFIGCDDRKETSDEKIANQQEKIQDELERKAGMPNVSSGTELKQVNYIYEMRDKADIVTYAYTMSLLTGKWHFAFKAIGFGIPYTTQRSAPTKVGGYHSQVGWLQTPQSEPNGLFPGASNGTWVFQISRKDGKIRLTKIENDVNTFQEPQPCDNPQDMY